ncbi:YjbF family lipoprotein [Paraglaciecola sp.]|uniref:YjbF family lipoprotein n=1 Tax=Paraglaciecola sp. TaxID=1920173 RepID=UPI003EFAE99C
MNTKNLMFSTLVLIFISGCSGTYHAYYQTLKLAFSKRQGASFTLADVQKSQSDIVLVKRGDRPAIIMALAYIENNEHKWVSQDNVLLITQAGRIVRTVGLSKDLVYVSNTLADPLKFLSQKMADIELNVPWARIVDFSGDEYGHPIYSSFNFHNNETIQALGLNINSTLIMESADYKTPSTYIQSNNNWQNYFWYDESGVLIKSKQKVSPLSEPLEITYLSRIARLNQ